MARYFHYNLLSGFNSRLREEATCGLTGERDTRYSFNSRLREEATLSGT